MYKFLITCCLLAHLSASTELADPSSFVAVTEDSRIWQTLETPPLAFDSSFLFGVSTATWQDSGSENCPLSQWTEWEKQCVPLDNRSGKSANLFALYQTPEGRALIIDRLEKIHATAYRFSIEWSHIQPEESIFDEEGLAPYIALCQDLQDAGITPMVTLHHFSEPVWFHKKGSFEKQENSADFLSFAEYVFPSLSQNYKGKPLVPYICTINEPAIEAFSRYVRGTFSPGYKLSFSRAALFLHNALKAHALVYDTLKPLNPDVQIGIVHQRLSFTPSNFLLKSVTYPLNLLLNEAPLHYLKTGEFSIKIPLLCNHHAIDSKPRTDFVGLQYYSRPLIGLMGSTSYYEPMTQMPFREDPEGLYTAILEVYDACGVPIIITENGISTHNEEQRERYLQRALYATHRAQEVIGKENLQGYFLWSFCKNAEWDMGMHPQDFAAYGIDAAGNLEEFPRKGIKPFIEASQLSWER